MNCSVIHSGNDSVTQRHARLRFLRLIGTRAIACLGREHAAVLRAYSDDSLHDVRVAARRVRALLDLFAPTLPRAARRQARKPLRRILRATRDLRDADVQARYVAKRLRKAGGGAERRALEYLCSDFERHRLALRKKAIAKIQRVNFDDASDELTRVFARALRRLSRHGGERWPAFVVDAVRDSMISAFGPLPEVDDDSAIVRLHSARVSLKRLRYTLELVCPVLDEVPEPLFDELRHLQRLLGDHHDLSLLHGRISKQIARLKASHARALGDGMDRVLLRFWKERAKVFREIEDAFSEEAQEALRQTVESCLPRSMEHPTRPGLASARSVFGVKLASGSKS